MLLGINLLCEDMYKYYFYCVDASFICWGRL